MKQWTCVMLVAALLVGASTAVASSDAEMQAQLQALQQRVMELEAKQSDQAINQRNAELVRQMVSELASHPQAMAADTGITAGYDKRFFIKSADDQFKLQFDTRLQIRHSYLLSDDGDKNLNVDGTRAGDGNGVDSSGSGAELERARLYLSGHVLKDLKFDICLEGDDDSVNEFIYTYQLKYSFMPEFGLAAGRFKGPFSKQENTSSGRFMLIDRSLANEIFNIDRCSGVEAFGTIDMGEIKPEYRVMIFNGLRNNNDTPVVNNDNSPGVAGRMMIPLLGATSADFADESDLSFHDNPVAMVGCSFAYGNDRTEDNYVGGISDNMEFLGPGVDGLTDIYELGGEMTMFSADASYKCQGFSVTLEGFYQHVDADSDELAFEQDFGNGRSAFDPVTGRALMDGYELDNFGWYAQAGYFIVPKTFELAARVSGVHVEDSNDSYEYCGGWNWYLAGQDLKLSMDVTYIDDLPMANTSTNCLGVQNNGLFLVRTQLQFQF